MTFTNSKAPPADSTLKPMRRVVTGVDAQGRSCIAAEGQAPGGHGNATITGRGFTDFWVWRKTPQPLHGQEDTGLWPDEFPGPEQGGHLRVVHWLSDGGDPSKLPPYTPVHAPKKRPGRSWDRGGGNNVNRADMHKTESLDFGVMFEGERVMECDEGTVTLHPGDIVIQGGSWHAWDSSRLGCHMAFDMFTAAFGPGDGTHGLQQSNAPVMHPKPDAKLPAGVKPARRVVAVDVAPGKSRIVYDGPSPDVRLDPARPGYALHRIWVAATHPAPLVPESLELPHVLVPPSRGTVLNVVSLPPDEAWKGSAGEKEARAFYASVDASAIATCGSMPGHPYSQKSSTVDFLMVTEGEITLVLDTGETVLKAGEIGIVRGGNHALSNRSGKPAVVAIASHDAAPGEA